MSEIELYDVIIIGGGPAGLNAAVVLGRCLRKVLVFDNGNPRNLRSQGIHNFITRDDIRPADFIKLGRKECIKYGVQLIDRRITNATFTKKGYFQVQDELKNNYRAKKILLASGLSDELPLVEGLIEIYGNSVFHCPYCDAWEVRNKKIGIYARDKNGLEVALSLITWTPFITYYSDGNKNLKSGVRATLREYGIPLVTATIQKLVSQKGKLQSIRLENGETLPCDALFFVNGYKQQCTIYENLGCKLGRKMVVLTNRLQQTNIPGVYAVGDASKDMKFVIVAAAEGAKAGVTINKELQKEDQMKRLVEVRKRMGTVNSPGSYEL